MIRHPGRRGTEAQGTRSREGEAGHNVLLEGKMGDTPRSPTISTRLQQIAQQASDHPTMVFTTLAHRIDGAFLREAYRRVRKDAAPGVDAVTAEDYAQALEANLQSLHERLRSGGYKAPPGKRLWLEKADGSRRPIGIPAFEDKIVQRAVAMLMGAVYEEDFYGFSYGFRPGRNAHDALKALRAHCRTGQIGWIIDADVGSYFDTIEHGVLQAMIQERINDGGLLRLIGKWLKAGIFEAGAITRAKAGTPQGGVASPLLANIYLHHVLDTWYERQIRPRLRGRSFLIRFADDFIIGCELEEDARRVLAVLPKRFARFGLRIHAEKTRLLPFGKPRRGERPGTFDFLGFTHYWGRSRQGRWIVKRKTSRKRLQRTLKQYWQWCRDHRHLRFKEQHRKLSRKLRGYYQYYGIRGNYKMLEVLYEGVERAWRYWLSRRGGKRGMSWERYERLRDLFPLPVPRIVHQV